MGAKSSIAMAARPLEMAPDIDATHAIPLCMRTTLRGCSTGARTATFDIHPLCTKIPEYVPDPLHPTHQLKLQTSSSGTDVGFVVFHLECILAPCETPTVSRSMGAPTTPAPPPYGPYGIAPPLHPWGVYGGLPPYSAYGPWYPYYSSTPHLYNWPSSTPFTAYAHACAYAPPPHLLVLMLMEVPLILVHITRIIKLKELVDLLNLP
ncbi:hypothetical protein CK203_018615 [Vitis vinifera]|uniref:Uncharacterized protein n=1 Tax=Vitis vinifera TaxID=29760 RepID=A0A438JAU7_VITVI|nr:hypothetical protein CK203_018615 [Vitis vinifera]